VTDRSYGAWWFLNSVFYKQVAPTELRGFFLVNHPNPALKRRGVLFMRFAVCALAGLIMNTFECNKKGRGSASPLRGQVGFILFTGLNYLYCDSAVLGSGLFDHFSRYFFAWLGLWDYRLR
jgi:hypothetical protein